MTARITLLLLIATPAYGEPVYQKTLTTPAPGLHGAGLTDTRTFAKSVTGALVKGEGTDVEVRDLSINGQAGLHAYPHFKPDWVHEAIDVGGPDAPVRAAGLVLNGKALRVSDVRLRDIPGNGMELTGEFGRGRNIDIEGARNGIILNTPDGKFQNITVGGVIEDGIIVNASGVVVIGDHATGAGGAACRIKRTARFTTAYHEAASIGTDIEPGADSTVIEGLDVGPGTCWDRCVRIGAHGCSVTGIRGEIRLNTPEHPDSAGVEIMPGMVHSVVEGSLVIQWDKARPDAKAIGLILRGHRGKVDLRGGWNAPTGGTFVRVAEGITGSTVEIRGKGDGGTVLDLSASGLDRVNGQGNEFKLKWAGSAARVIYPEGSKKYNLAPGTQLWVDGVLQEAKR